MKKFLDSNPVTSIIAVAVIIVGAVVVVTGDLTYKEYLEQSGIFLAGLGLVGVGRSLMNKG